MDFLEEDYHLLKELFDLSTDDEKDKCLSEENFRSILDKMNLKINDKELSNIICTVDIYGSGKINFDQFLYIVKKFYTGKPNATDFIKGVTLINKQKKGNTSTVDASTVDASTLRGYCCHITKTLTNEEFDEIYRDLEIRNDTINVANFI